MRYLPLVSARSALAETSGGFASRVDWQPEEAALAGRFADMAIEALPARGIREMQRNPPAAAAQCHQRIKFIRDNCLWAASAKEWVTWLSQLANGDSANATPW